MIRFSISYSSPINLTTLSAIPASVNGGHISLALMLIERGANVDDKDNEGNTPLCVQLVSAMMP